jgi:hypothetical protein
MEVVPEELFPTIPPNKQNCEVEVLGPKNNPLFSQIPIERISIYSRLNGYCFIF